MEIERQADKLRDELVGIVAREVADPRVLAALRAVPRHWFVPEVPLAMAYEDRPLGVGFGAAISQPTVVGLMSEALELGGGERILEVGTGTGYQATVLSALVGPMGQIDTIEIIPELADRASRTLRRIGVRNVRVHLGDGWVGLPGRTFDRIVLTAAPEELPEALVDQLAEGGLLVAPVGSETQRLERDRKRRGRLFRQDLGEVRFVPMVRG